VGIWLQVARWCRSFQEIGILYLSQLAKAGENPKGSCADCSPPDPENVAPGYFRSIFSGMPK
jgi:hypothetical protein